MISGTWQYAAPGGGIVNSAAAVTIKASAGAEFRNFIEAIQITAEVLGLATEIAIRDGATGPVLWRTKLTAAGIIGGMNVQFPKPLAGSPGTLLEVVTLTATVTGAVYFNAQGYSAHN